MVAANASESRESTRVIVMEDDLLLRRMLESILRTVGYKVLSAGDGAEGMRAVRAHGADIVITDLFMPEQDGLQTIMQLKREFPAVRVVAMTAGASYLSIENARAAATLIGADAFIEKPLDHRVLLDTMAELRPV